MKTPWLTIRLLLFALGFGSSVCSTFDAGATKELEQLLTGEWLTATLGVLALQPFALLFVVGTQVLNPFSAKQWSVPDHVSNPFRLREPLSFFHFFAYFMFACALGYLVAALWAGAYVAAYGLLLTGAGLSTLLGIRLCRLVFKRKFVRTH